MATEQDNIQQLTAVLHYFGLPEPIETEILTAGFVNQNIAATTTKGEYVVKFLKRVRMTNIENDIAIQEQLTRKGIGSIRYLHRANGDFLYRNGDVAAVVSPRIKGVNLHPYSQETATALGAVLGEFHTTVKALPHNHKGWLNPEIAQQPIQKEADPLTVRARDLIARGMKLFVGDLPQGIIHSDLHEDNALVLPTEPAKVVAIMDFEEAERNVFLVDIARAILSVCRDKTNNNLDPVLIEKYIEAYNAERKLTDQERTFLPQAIYYTGGVNVLWFIENNYPQYAIQYANRAESFGKTV